MIYLNSGTHSLTPPSILDAMQRYQREYETNPTLNLFHLQPRLWRVQTRLARFFGADPRDIFLRSNVTQVLNEFIQGVPLPKGSEIALTDLEYGAIVNLVRFRCERDGLKQRTIHLPGTAEGYAKLTPSALVDLIVSQLGPETRMLVVSDVMTYNGLKLPLEGLSAKTRKRGILLVVDGAHGPGSTALDFRKLSNVDFYGGNLHKWMMGPKGTSFGWVHPDHQKTLTPLLAGWTTFETTPPFDEFGDGSRFAVKMLIVGCQDYSPFYALEDLVEHWEKQGPAKLRARIYELQADLEEKMKALHVPSASPPFGIMRGPLMAYEMPEKARKNAWGLFVDLAEKHGLQVAMPQMQGRAVLRLSPHVYNTLEENTQAVEILRRTIYKLAQ